MGKQHKRAVPPRYTCFYGFQNALSNFWPGSFPHLGWGGDNGPKTFYHAEAAMQASKAELAEDTKAEQALYRADTGYLAQKIGRGISLSREQVQQWDATKVRSRLSKKLPTTSSAATQLQDAHCSQQRASSSKLAETASGAQAEKSTQSWQGMGPTQGATSWAES